MSHLPTPFVELAADDTVTRANNAFIKLVGLKPQDFKTKKFCEFVVDETTYANEQSARMKEDDDGTPQLRIYDLRLKKPNNRSVQRQIVSAVKSENKANNLPETFGILLMPGESINEEDAAD